MGRELGRLSSVPRMRTYVVEASFSDEGIENGIEICTPLVGDRLLNFSSIEVPTLWVAPNGANIDIGIEEDRNRYTALFGNTLSLDGNNDNTFSYYKYASWEAQASAYSPIFTTSEPIFIFIDNGAGDPSEATEGIVIVTFFIITVT